MLRALPRQSQRRSGIDGGLGTHGWFKHALAALAPRHLHRVVPVKAGAAERFRPLLGRRHEFLERHEAERVGPDRLPDLLNRAVTGDELIARREVDAVEA